jgi:hypothetical protein
MISVMPLFAGCPDPQGRFNEFGSRFADAGSAPDAGGVVADISGTFLYALFVPAAGALKPAQALATVTLTSLDPPTATLAIQFLTIDGRIPVGDTATYSNVAVSAVGTFTINVTRLVIDSTATELGADVIAENVVISGEIKSTDFFCGTLSGMVTAPVALDLSGTTFGARRVVAGQTGSDLPTAILDCAHEPVSGSDAGTSAIDAGTSTPDAP